MIVSVKEKEVSRGKRKAKGQRKTEEIKNDYNYTKEKGITVGLVLIFTTMLHRFIVCVTTSITVIIVSYTYLSQQPSDR